MRVRQSSSVVVLGLGLAIGGCDPEGIDNDHGSSGRAAGHTGQFLEATSLCEVTYDGSPAVYVSNSGDDSNSGVSPVFPVRTIQHAYDLATDLQYDYVLVAAGTYDEMPLFRNLYGPPGPSYILGGFNEDFTLRDNTDRGRHDAAYRTAVTNFRLLECSDKFVDGFVVERFSVSQASATLTNNTVIGDYSGIGVFFAHATIACNKVMQRVGTLASSFIGIRLEGTANVFNNVVYLPNSMVEDRPIDSVGIYLESVTTDFIANNTIVVATTGNAQAIGIQTWSRARVVNNLIDVRSDAGGSSTCIRSAPYLSDDVENNSLSHCTNLWESPNETLTSLYRLAPLGNVRETPAFGGEGPFHLAPQASATLRAGGRDLTSAGVIGDGDAQPRTSAYAGSTPPSNVGAAGWSIGAFEMDQ